jgi:hypothetical protein
MQSPNFYYESLIEPFSKSCETVLVQCLRTTVHTSDDDDGDISNAFSEYVKVRKPPADDIISKSYLLGLNETAGGIARLARDLIFFTVLKTGLFVWSAVDINTVRV